MTASASPAEYADPPNARPSPSGGHGALVPAIVAVAVVVAVIVGLGFANVIPGFHLNSGSPASSSPPGTTTTYPLVFVAQGLPQGTSWSVTLSVSGTAESSTNSTLTFHEATGTYAYSVAAPTGFKVAPASGSVVLNGAGNTVDLTFSATTVTAATYSVTFTEAGLPASTSWSVTLNGTKMSATTSTIAFSMANGSYPYTVGAVGAELPTPSSGTVPVAGAPVGVSIHFAPGTNAEYAVTFNETGLPAATSWSIDFNGTVASSTTASIALSVPNGSYSYAVGTVAGYMPSPSAGTIPVSGAAVYTTIAFSPSQTFGTGPTYPIWFNQTGLGGNVSWTAYVWFGSDALGQSAEGGAQALDLPNGTYNWSVYTDFVNTSLPPGSQYISSPGGGVLTVDGKGQSVDSVFTAIEPTATNYSVVFSETGLPTSAHWWVFVGNDNGSAAAGSTIRFSLPNGTWFYNFSTDAPAYSGYEYGVVTIVGSAQSLSVAFWKVTTVLFNFTDVPGGVSWYVVLSQSGVAVTGAFNAGPTLAYFDLPNGTFDWVAGVTGYRVTPSSGTLTLDGKFVEQNFTLSKLPVYSVTFTEAGLPANASWQVQVWPVDDPNDYTYYSTGGANLSQSFGLSNGTYQWLLGNNLSNVPSPGSGTFVVNGGAVTVYANFTAPIVADLGVTFVSSAYYLGAGSTLPAGDSWSVTFNGVTRSTTGVLIYFQVPNGTYSYTITAPTGFGTVPAGGELTVDATPSGSGGPTAAFVSVDFGASGAAPALTASAGPAILSPSYAAMLSSRE